MPRSRRRTARLRSSLDRLLCRVVLLASRLFAEVRSLRATSRAPGRCRRTVVACAGCFPLFERSLGTADSQRGERVADVRDLLAQRLEAQERHVELVAVVRNAGPLILAGPRAVLHLKRDEFSGEGVEPIDERERLAWWGIHLGIAPSIRV